VTNKRALFLLILSVASAGFAQEKPAAAPDDLIDSVDQWMQENLDDDVLRALGQLDRDRVRKFLAEVQKRFNGTSVYDLGSLQDSARQLLPVLEQFEETQPYAVWLKSHLDYFDTANELRRQMTPSTPRTNAPIPAPSLKIQRMVWNRQLEKRPLPSLAEGRVPQLKRIFEAEGVPPELVWVAEVESSFNPEARSPAGAAGLFQLMPATAKRLNLSSLSTDERLQPEKNARAAARYLRYLYGRFGDWRLALAAYNAGETRVENLLQKSKTRSFDAIASRLPAETQMYVPKIEATVRKREARALSDLKLRTG